ncbi:hypothetical protein F5Y16DRAFT_404989 [Xylariaceae sp. FL0255]|nr:hypothetical protein F5Y16DRAFT_404989 [Xylariaceae sp. FL0255]
MLAASVMQYPNVYGEPSDEGIPDSEYLRPGSVTTVDFVPLLWYSRILSEEFWSLPGARSARFFHRQDVLTGKTPNHAPQDRLLSRRTLRFAAPELQDLRGAFEDKDMWDKFIEEWKNRQAFWKSLRSEWNDEGSNDEWQDSAWSWPLMREKCHEFKLAFARKDEFTCENIATDLVACIRWKGRKEARYKKSFPGPTQLKGWDWVWHTLGFLMLAALPIRDEDKDRVMIREEIVTMTPSRSAAAADRLHPIRFREKFDTKESSAGVSFFYELDGNSAFTDELIGEEVHQDDYLQHVQKILLEYIQNTEAIVHKVFYDSIFDMWQKMVAARRLLETEYPHAAWTKWAPDWDFEVPDYDPTQMYFDTFSQRPASLP